MKYLVILCLSLFLFSCGGSVPDQPAPEPTHQDDEPSDDEKDRHTYKEKKQKNNNPSGRGGIEEPN